MIAAIARAHELPLATRDIADFDGCQLTLRVTRRGRQPAAHEVVDRAEHIVLTERDGVRVLELLQNPPKPAPALLAAARRRAARS
jgi:hypothetical protein